MANDGFRIDVTNLRRKLARKERALTAESFRPELEKHATAVLNDAAASTPVRDLSTIQAAQNKQYDARINCIPSAHELIDPSLRVNSNNGQHWLFSGGKWYLASEWKLPPNQWAQYQALEQERNRRMQKPRGQFISERAQARFLYRKSWLQVGQSLGLRMRSTGQVANSHTRRKPPKEPPRGYGQWRGGRNVLSAVVYNPFLEIPSRYKQFSGRAILAAAQAKNAPRFLRATEAKMKRTLANA